LGTHHDVTHCVQIVTTTLIGAIPVPVAAVPCNQVRVAKETQTRRRNWNRKRNRRRRKKKKSTLAITKRKNHLCHLCNTSATNVPWQTITQRYNP